MTRFSASMRAARALVPWRGNASLHTGITSVLDAGACSASGTHNVNRVFSRTVRGCKDREACLFDSLNTWQNQDRLLIQWDQNSSSLLLCVFDGHGKRGGEVAEYLKSEVARRIFGHAIFKSCAPEVAEVERIVQDAVRAIDEDVIQQGLGERSGSTALIALVLGSELLIANVGDTRIVRGYSCKASGGSIRAEALTVDQSPCSEGWGAEEERALAAGCSFNQSCSPAAVETPQALSYLLKEASDIGHPGKYMRARFTRSVGDQYMKPCTTAEPVFTRHSLGPDDKYLVIASDGLWEFLGNQNVIDIVSGAVSPNQALDRLLETSRQKWMKDVSLGGGYVDDISIILADICAIDSLSSSGPTIHDVMDE